MKTLTKFIIAAFAVAILPAFALTANAAPGDIFVSDGARAIIDKIAPDGTVTRFAQAPDVGGITGLAFDSAGNLFEADYSSGTIYKYAPDGTRATFATGLNNPLAAPFPTPTNRTFDLATGAETTTSPNAFSTQLFGNGNVVLSPVDRWTLELPLAENPWFMSVSPTDIAEFDGGELADAILSLEFLNTT